MRKTFKIELREGVENPVAALRHRCGLSLVELAIRLGLSSAYVSMVERGAVASPETLWQALERAGIDANGMVEQYEAFRQASIGPLEVA